MYILPIINMGKRNFVAYLDDNLIKIAQNKGINISHLFNQVLENVAERGERLDQLDEDVLREKIAKLTEEINTTKALLVQTDEAKHGKILNISEEILLDEEKPESEKNVSKKKKHTV